MPVWQTVITVTATLVGAFGGTIIGSLMKSRADHAARVHEWQVSIVDIFGDLVAALSDHRAAMWDLEAARLRADHAAAEEKPAAEAEVRATLAASLVTRSAVTRPRGQFVILAPQLADVADRAVQAVYAMDTYGNTTRSEELLASRRSAAKTAISTLEAETAKVLRRLGAGLPTGGLGFATERG